MPSISLNKNRLLPLIILNVCFNVMNVFQGKHKKRFEELYKPYNKSMLKYDMNGMLLHLLYCEIS